jgi:outer membrane protein TolC/septal ring-binding cell division protein DamX
MMIKKSLQTSLLTFLLISNSSFVHAADDTGDKNSNNKNEISKQDPRKFIDDSKGINRIDAQKTNQTGIVSSNVLPSAPKSLYMDNKEENINDYYKVSLIDVILETVSKNYNIKVAREKVEQAQLNLDEAYAGYKPTVDLEYKYGKTTRTPSDEDEEIENDKWNDETISVQIKQNLYAGGATKYKIEGLKKSLEIAKNRYELAISQEIQNAVKAYFGVVFSYQSLYATRINMEMLQKILEIVTIKYDLGAASIGDISSIKASVANAQSKLSRTNSKFVEALKYYEYIVGEDFKYTLPYEFDFDTQVEPIESLLEKANEQNLNIVSYLISVENEQFKLKSAQSAFKPKVDVQFSHRRTYDEEGEPEEFYRQNENEAFVTLRYNLYNGGRDSNKVLSVYSSIRELKYKIKEERRKVKWIISNLHQSLNSLTQAIASTVEEVESSEVTVDSYWEAFQNGEQDLQTLLTAQRQLNSAQVSLIEAHQNRLNDYFKLKFETGQLVSHFNLDPTKDNFIDFTQSDYKNAYYQKVHENLDLIAYASANAKKEQETKEVEVKKVDTLEDILKFKDKFLDAPDDYYTIKISDFENMYDSFGFLKDNNMVEEIFMVDVLKEYKLRNIVTYGLFEDEVLANEALEQINQSLAKSYDIVSIKEVKSLYKEYLDGFDELKPQQIVQTNTIKLAPKAPKPFYTNEAFKQQFMDASENRYTINLVTFNKLDDAIALVNDENIYDQSFIFRYGANGEWIKVVYGVFESYEMAQLAMQQLSGATQQKYYPIIEHVKHKQELFEKYSNLELGRPSKPLGEVEYEEVSSETTTELRKLDEGNLIDTSALEESKNSIEVQKKTLQESSEEVIEKSAEEMIEEPTQEAIEEITDVQEKENEQEQNFKEQFLDANENQYSINMATFKNKEGAQRFLEKNNIEHTAFYFKFGEQEQFYKVMYGVFDSYEQTLEAIENLPLALKENAPMGQKIFRMQALYDKYHNPQSEFFIPKESL